jgi:hypothetical protein
LQAAIAKWALRRKAPSQPICLIHQSIKFEFGINLETAKVLGLNVPPTLLAAPMRQWKRVDSLLRYLTAGFCGTNATTTHVCSNDRFRGQRRTRYAQIEFFAS